MSDVAIFFVGLVISIAVAGVTGLLLVGAAEDPPE